MCCIRTKRRRDSWSYHYCYVVFGLRKNACVYFLLNLNKLSIISRIYRKYRYGQNILREKNTAVYQCTGSTHAYQSLACETAINTDFSELFSLKRIYVKYKNAILSLIDSFFRIWKDKTYGQVLSQIFNYYNETRSQDRTNQISRKVQ